MPPLVTLLTDFGTRDWFVAAMKARILSRFPDGRLIDISHEVPPQAVDSASFVLASVWREFPSGTIHLVVVDPDVGSDRRAVIVRADGHWFVGPDNGVFARATEGLRTEVFEIDIARLGSQSPVSATFHGRDVFAPAVAELAVTGDPSSLAHPVAALVPGRTRAWRARDFVIEAPVVWVDRFGNCITDVPAERLPPRPKVRGEDFEIQGLHRTYADGPAGQAIAYVGSNGTLELAVPSGRADMALGLAVGHRLRIEADDGGPW